MDTDLKTIVLTEGDIIKAHSDFYVCNDECELYEEYGEIIIHPDEDHEIRGESVEDIWSYDSSTKEYKHIYEAPKEILTEEEKEYLEAVLTPFRDNRIKYIKKSCIINSTSHRIMIKIVDEFAELHHFQAEFIYFPLFQKEMYKGMETDKEYTLDELRLFKE